MTRTTHTLARWMFLTLLALMGLVTACGDAQDPEPADTPNEAWSDPASQRAQGSPDGAGGGVQTASTLLQRLRELVRSGTGAGRPGFEHDVGAVAAVLWDGEGSPEERAAANVHMQVAAIAAESGAWLAASPQARVERADEATSFRIYDAWLEAAAGTPDSYAAWCALGGAALLREREEALRERFFPPRK